jgi:hypothetical protein
MRADILSCPFSCFQIFGHKDPPGHETSFEKELFFSSWEDLFVTGEVSGEIDGLFLLWSKVFSRFSSVSRPNNSALC